MDEPFHSVHFYFPCKVLNGVADDAKAPWIGELRYEPGKGNDDPVVRAPTLSILPVLHWPEQANQLVVDHVMLTVGFYVGQVYGSLEVVTRRPRGLAPWPERRAKEYFDANLDGQVPLAELAREMRRVDQSILARIPANDGNIAHRWLCVGASRTQGSSCAIRNRRCQRRLWACGFADQSHFTRAVTKLSGTSPGAWQRIHHEWAHTLGIPNCRTCT
jgi:hypothetical protein